MKKIKQIAMLILMLAILAPAGFAHQRRTVADKYVFVAGFVNEPAFNGEMNGVDLKVTTKDEQPIEKLEETLKVKVKKEGNEFVLALPFRKLHKQPGKYAAYFLPAEPGKYIFYITGTIEGNAIDETFEPGEGSYHEVDDSAPLRFPSKMNDKK